MRWVGEQATEAGVNRRVWFTDDPNYDANIVYSGQNQLVGGGIGPHIFVANFAKELAANRDTIFFRNRSFTANFDRSLVGPTELVFITDSPTVNVTGAGTTKTETDIPTSNGRKIIRISFTIPTQPPSCSITIAFSD